MQHLQPRHVAKAHDRRDLDADDEPGADDAGEDLRDQPRALGPDQAEEADGHQHRQGRRHRAHCGQHAIGGEPMRAAINRQHVDQRAGEEAGEPSAVADRGDQLDVRIVGGGER